MSVESNGYCLVLGGGGAKGVYHIGVWRALRELGIEVDAFIGASIGAVIAGFLAQDAGEKLEEIGRGISIDDILALPEELTDNGEVRRGREALAGVPGLLKSAREKGGLDTGPLRRLLSEELDEEAIRSGGKDLGVVTFSLDNLEPREVFIESMAPGSLVDYIMASSAFPGFKRPQIEGKSYIDGGVYDNVPYAMARRRGYRRIIVSDVSGAGRNRRPHIEGSLTVYIKNSIDMGGVLDFNRKFLDRFTLLGYLDAMQAFGRLVGYSYFLEPNEEAEAAYADRVPDDLPQAPEYMRYDRRFLLVALECSASILELERVRAYDYAGLEAAVAERHAVIEEKIAAARSGAKAGVASLAPALHDAVNKRHFEECPYYYYRLIREALPGAAGSMLTKALEGLYPELPLGAAWLERE